MLRSASLALPPNKKVGIYTFHNQNVLGEGSYSIVYLGQNDETKQPVAIKVITRKSLVDNYMYETLLSEIEILKKLDHPNIVRLYDVLNTSNNVYIITEYCNGGTLDEILKRERKLSEQQAIFVMKDLLHGFKEILKQNIVHRNIKPANIFVSDGRFKIGDFGFAKKVDDLDEKMMKSIVGTPLYMSPECLENKLYSSKNDVYSLGIIFFKLLYGRTPWPSRTRIELMQNMRANPLIIPNEESISMASKQFLLQALQYSENERINWQEIYDNQIFRDEDVIIIEKIKETKNEDVYETKKEEITEAKEVKSNHMISTHIKIIKKIDKTVKFLRECQEISKSQAIKLAVLLMKACEHHTTDLSKRIQEIKQGSTNGQYELMTQIEQEVMELEYKNSDELKILTKILKKQDILLQDDNETKGLFEEISEGLRPLIRECNHRIFEGKRKNAGQEKRTLLELLNELIGMFQIVNRFRGKEGELDIPEGSIIDHILDEDQGLVDYTNLRKLIYEFGI